MIACSFLIFQIPSKKCFVSSARIKIYIVLKNLDFSNFRSVFFQMSNEFSGSNFPNSDFTIHSPCHKELEISGEINCRDSSFVSIVNCPELLLSINSKRPDFSIWPSRDDYFFCKHCAYWVSCGRGETSRVDWIVISVPKTNSSIFWTCWEFIWNAIHIAAI